MDKLEFIKQAVFYRFMLNKRLRGFYHVHILIVDDCAQELMQRHGGDSEIIVPAVHIHDIGWTLNENPRNHDVEGAPIAREMLVNAGYPEDVVAKIVRIVLTHSCRPNSMPETLEEKIVATADGMAQFNQYFYLWSLDNDNPDTAREDRVNRFMAAAERAFNEKMLLEGERERILPQYEALERLAQYG